MVVAATKGQSGRGLWRSPPLGAVAGGVLLDGLTISGTFIGSLVPAASQSR
jgi:hypothetical protein